MPTVAQTDGHSFNPLPELILLFSKNEGSTDATASSAIFLPSSSLERLRVCKARGVTIVPPVSKVLACGDKGFGAMAEVADVVDTAMSLLEKQATAKRQAALSGLPPFSL